MIQMPNLKTTLKTKNKYTNSQANKVKHKVKIFRLKIKGNNQVNNRMPSNQ